MFGLRLVTKREMALLAGTIEDLRKEKQALQELVEHERKRSEGAINLLLIKTQGAALTPSPGPQQEAEEERVKNKMFNIFGDEYETEPTQDRLLEDLQNG